MKVLSLFDGMSCAMLALLEQGIKVDKYIAYEIDKYAIKTATHNFPEIEQRGDVFNADFTEFKGFDYLMGGSPCTYWSIAQKNNRETEASGIGWELFSQYVRAIKEAEPRYFIYENNKSMSNAIRESITEAFGFEPICINSALVSAQNRQRLYWVGKRNEDGSYSKVEIEQPEDKEILSKDILENGTSWREKAYCIDANCFKGGNLTSPKKQSGLRMMAAEPVILNTTDNGDKARTLMAGYYKYGTATLITNKGFKGGTTCVGEPVRVGSLPRPNGELSQSQAFRIYDIEGKSVNINSGGGGAGGKTGLYAIPINITEDEKSQTIKAQYQKTSVANIVGYTSTYGASGVAEPVGYAEPCEWNEDGKPIKAMSYADGKTYQVYEVKDGLITIKGKEYPIKLDDGFYIIRKLTVRECMRLQTVPEWYEFPVSDTQAYKMLGNGWTVQVIAHLLKHITE